MQHKHATQQQGLKEVKEQKGQWQNIKQTDRNVGSTSRACE